MTETELSAYATAAAAIIALALPTLGAAWRWLLRPVLTVDFENRPPWTRRVKIAGTAKTALYLRVRVRNTGHRTARDVSGRLAEILSADGHPVEDFDPVALHWAGTRQEAAEERLQLLPGQTEFLDVIRVTWDVVNDDWDDLDHFEVVAHDATPRGIALHHRITGQRLSILFLAENARGVGIQLQLPAAAPPFAALHLTVKHRPMNRFGEAVTPWEEKPAPHEVGGISVVNRTHEAAVTPFRQRGPTD